MLHRWHSSVSLWWTFWGRKFLVGVSSNNMEDIECLWKLYRFVTFTEANYMMRSIGCYKVLTATGTLGHFGKEYVFSSSMHVSKKFQ